MASSDKLAILITGQPPAEIEAQRGDYGRIIAAATIASRGSQGRPLEFVEVDVRTTAPPDPSTLAGCIISGSTAQTFDDAPWIDETAEWLRAAIAAELPILGICFGHQLLAQALGGTVGLHPLGREVGTIAVTQHDCGKGDPLLTGLPSTFLAHATHLATVTDLPPNARVLAASNHDPHQIIAFGNRIYGVQFHPEFDRSFVDAYLHLRREGLSDEGFNVDDLRQSLRDVDANRVLDNFCSLLG